MCCSLHSLFFYHVFTSQLNLSRNQLCGIDDFGGTYTAEGITAIADALKVTPSLTSLDLSSNLPFGSSDGPAFAEALAPGIAASASLTKIS